MNDLEGHSTDYPQTYYSYNDVKNIVNREIQITNQAIPAEGGAFSITNTGEGWASLNVSAFAVAVPSLSMNTIR